MCLDAAIRNAFQEFQANPIGKQRVDASSIFKTGDHLQFLATTDDPSQCAGMLDRPMVQSTETPWFIRSVFGPCFLSCA